MRRANEIASLTGLLRDTTAPGLKIAAVVGPGGVGKSYLLDETSSRPLNCAPQEEDG